MNSPVKKQKGFTIIEVVLVLAIAGLIFMIVFLALPALQRQQRDTQRRTDASRVLTAIQNYQSNNSGGIPNTQVKVDTLLSSYLNPQAGDVFQDPRGSDYSLTWKAGADTAVPGDNTIFVYSGAKCSGQDTVVGGTNQAAARVAMENGGVYCVGNN